MKILIVSWYFPPTNTIGAVRLGKFAKFLFERGHDVAVVAGRDPGYPETLPLGFELDRLAYAKSKDINAPLGMVGTWLKRLRGRRSESAAAPPVAPSGIAGAPAKASLLRRLSNLYTLLLNIPDQEIGWYPDLVRQGMRLCRDWRPDIVFGSGPLFTAFLGCRTLSSRLQVPWVAELRDRWADDVYTEFPAWRATIEQRIERAVLGSAVGLVTVTEPWSVFYREKYGKPVETVYNGYDPGDFPFDPAAPPETNTPYVNIVYTGGIYPGRRDPTPLFEALRLLGPDADKFRVNFYSTRPEYVYPLADRSGVRPFVNVHPAVRYSECLKLQWDADVLLLLQWNDPKEAGNCPGKFFEYLASLRPILGIGYEGGVPASFVRERNAGAFANDPKAIVKQLQAWAAEKERLGAVRRLPLSARQGLERHIQFERLEKFLDRFVEAPR